MPRLRSTCRLFRAGLGPARRRVRATALAPALGLVLLAGCGSSATRSDSAATRREALVRRAEQRRVEVARQQRITAEVSDMNPRMSCEDWLSSTPAARNAYLAKGWPHLHVEQVETVVRAQSLGCQQVPGHTRIGSQRAAVYIVLLGFEGIYEEILGEGIKESLPMFEAEALGVYKASPRQQPPASKRKPKAHRSG